MQSRPDWGKIIEQQRTEELERLQRNLEAAREQWRKEKLEQENTTP